MHSPRTCPYLSQCCAGLSVQSISVFGVSFYNPQFCGHNGIPAKETEDDNSGCETREYWWTLSWCKSDGPCWEIGPMPVNGVNDLEVWRQSRERKLPVRQQARSANVFLNIHMVTSNKPSINGSSMHIVITFLSAAPFWSQRQSASQHFLNKITSSLGEDGSRGLRNWTPSPTAKL